MIDTDQESAFFHWQKLSTFQNRIFLLKISEFNNLFYRMKQIDNDMLRHSLFLVYEK